MNGAGRRARPTGTISGLILLVLGIVSIAAWGWGAWWLSTSPPAFVDWIERVAPRPDPPAPVVHDDSPPAEAVAGPDGVLIRPPSWRVHPAPEFPQAAMRAGIEEGAVEIRCEVLATGQLGACEVLSETPEGQGFAATALTAAREARLWPRTVDGLATDGSIVFTIRYRLG